MKATAAAFLEHFDFDFSGNGPAVVPAADAPEALTRLVDAVAAEAGADAATCVYEALSILAEAEDPRLTEVDEKVCPLSTYRLVVEHVERAARG